MLRSQFLEWGAISSCCAAQVHVLVSWQAGRKLAWDSEAAEFDASEYKEVLLHVSEPRQRGAEAQSSDYHKTPEVSFALISDDSEHSQWAVLLIFATTISSNYWPRSYNASRVVARPLSKQFDAPRILRAQGLVPLYLPKERRHASSSELFYFCE